MAKEARVSFEGEVLDRVMTVAYPAIKAELQIPVGKLSQYDEVGNDYTNEALDHGWKQRFGDFRALDKDMSDREKDQEAFDRASTYKEHLLSGGEWKMTPERGLTADLIEAVKRVMPSFNGEPTTDDLLRAAAKHDPNQVKGWRADLRVKNALAKISVEKTSKALKEAGKDKPALLINLPK
jgi:hypothetical protein